MTSRSFAPLFVVLSLAGAAGCTSKLQDQYQVEIVGALDSNYLMGATTGVLELNDKEVARTGISPGTPFSLTGAGIDTNLITSAVFRFKALDGAGMVVAQGQSPEIELLLGSPPVVRLF